MNPTASHCIPLLSHYILHPYDILMSLLALYRVRYTKKHIPFQDKAPGVGGVKKIETPNDSALIHTPLGVTAEVTRGQAGSTQISRMKEPPYGGIG